MELNSTPPSAANRPAQRRRETTLGKICDAPAIYSYVGVIVCASCKMFFKRNALADQGNWRCRTNGQCVVNIYQRPLCSVCRMKKCLARGMKIELFRGSTAKKGSGKGVVSIRPLNLLQTDQSTLTATQWTHLSNIIHCYDEYSQYSVAQSFIEEQNRLPMKMRFRSSAIIDLMIKVAPGGQRLFERNADYLSLPPSDRTILLRNTFRIVGGLNSTVISYLGKIFNNPFCRNAIDLMYGENASAEAYTAGSRLDPDMVFFKLVLSALMFSTFTHMNYTSTSSLISHDIKTAIGIQDTYLELAWRYMIYKYGHERAVRSFSSLILSLFALHRSVDHLLQTEECNQIIENLAKQTEQVVITHA